MNLNKEEALINSLCSLYKSYGYKKYNPECFEEYSLFLENRDFLISKNVITFAGLGGKLLALRPDVTLSIIKHLNVDEYVCEKLYYNENVYRQTSGESEFKEISQVGVEVIGAVDTVCQAEICLLILKTLAEVSKDNVLCISHMAYTEGFFDSLGVNAEQRAILYGFLKSKNAHDFEIFADNAGFCNEDINIFTAMCNTDGSTENIIPIIKSTAKNDKMARAVCELEEVTEILYKLGYGKKIKLDFSVISDENYYDGLIFNGYINGIPNAVLSGGRYDKLVKKFNKNCGAIGFALYLGLLERYFRTEDAPVDEVIIYGNNAYRALETAERAISEGRTIRLTSDANNEIRGKKIINLEGDKQ